MYFFVSFLFGVASAYLFNYFRYILIILLFIYISFILFKKRFTQLLIVCAGLSLGFIHTYINFDKELIFNNKFVIKGVFESYPNITRSGLYQQRFKIDSAFDIYGGKYEEELNNCKIDLILKQRYEIGTRGEFLIKFLNNKDRLNPGDQIKDNLKAFVLKSIHVESSENDLYKRIEEYRYAINRFILQRFSDNSAGFLCSITTGYKSNISKDIRDAFNKTGLAHILSISGTHFGLFSLCIFNIIKLFLRYVPYNILIRLTIYLTPSQLSAILSFPFMLFYLLLSGSSIPAIRAFIMISLFLLGILISRKGYWFSFLALSAFIIVLWEPENIKSISFQLSFLAVLFIGFSIKEFEHEKENSKIKRLIKKTLMITLFASIGTAPIVAYYFHYVSLISPLTNLLIAPVIGFIVIPLSVLSSFIFLFTGKFVFDSLISFFTDYSIQLIKIFADIPYSSVNVPAIPLIIIIFFYISFNFYFRFKRKYLLVVPFIPIIIFIIVSLFKEKDLSVTFLDVGQGDSAVIQLPDNYVIVLDTGRTGYEAASLLRYLGKETIDVLVISHIHPDHTGGISYLLRNFNIKQLWDNGRVLFSQELLEKLSSVKHYSFNKGDIIEFDSTKIYVLHPYKGFYTMFGSKHDSQNNESLVFKIVYKDKTLLFTGDIEEEAQKELMNLGIWLRSDVIKVPHHGAKSSAYRPFFEIVSPKIAIISSGRNNPFNHPHQEMLDVLKDADIYRTDIDGAIKVSVNNSSIKIKTWKDSSFVKVNTLKDEIKNIRLLFATW